MTDRYPSHFAPPSGRLAPRGPILEDERRRAARIHYSFLPSDYRDPYLNVSVLCRPYGELGGDYCSVVPLEDGRVLVCLCDAVGHDISSALYAARINTFVLAHAPRAEHPCELVDLLNDFLCTALGDIGLFASFFVAILDPAVGALDYAGAGHPPVLHYREHHRCVELLHSEATVVGIERPAPLPCSAFKQPLAAGDKLVFYTDGVIEHEGDDGAGLYGIPRLQDFLVRYRDLSSADFNRRLMEALSAFGGGPLRDDMLLVTVSRGER